MSLPKFAKWLCKGTVPDCNKCKMVKALTIAIEALKKIAKPALGGKQQQWMAQETLRRIEELGKCSK